MLGPSNRSRPSHAAVCLYPEHRTWTQARLAEPRLADPALHSVLPALRLRHAVASEERAARKQIKEVEAVLMKEELKGMRRVLRKLGHLSDDGVIQNKGRVACEVSTADELLTTEVRWGHCTLRLPPWLWVLTRLD